MAAVEEGVGTIRETLYLRLVFLPPRKDERVAEALGSTAGRAYVDAWPIGQLEGVLAQVDRMFRYAYLVSGESTEVLHEGLASAFTRRFEEPLRETSTVDLMAALEASIAAYSWGRETQRTRVRASPRIVALRVGSPLTILLAAPFATVKFLQALLDLAVATWNVEYRIAADRAEQIARMRAAEREEAEQRLATAEIAAQILKLENPVPVGEIDVWVSDAEEPPPALNDAAA